MSSFREFIGNAVMEAQERWCRYRDAEVRRLLGQWVSELEPVVIYGPRFELLGLGFAHGEQVVIPARQPHRAPWEFGD